MLPSRYRIALRHHRSAPLLDASVSAQPRYRRPGEGRDPFVSLRVGGTTGSGFRRDAGLGSGAFGLPGDRAYRGKMSGDVGNGLGQYAARPISLGRMAASTGRPISP